MPLIGGVTASPGQVLDPLDELIEQFSAVMLAASISLSAQRFLISLGSLEWVTGALTVALVGLAVVQVKGQASPRWLGRLVAILLFIRFAVPVAALVSEAAYAAVMSTQYEKAQAEVNTTSMGLLDRLSDLKESAGKLRNPVQAWNEVKAQAESQVRHVVTLMAIFVLQTIVLPLLFLWAGYRVVGAALTWRSVLNWPRGEPTSQ